VNEHCCTIFFPPYHFQLQILLFYNFHHLQPTNLSHAMVHWWCTPIEMLLLFHIITAYWIVEVNEAFCTHLSSISKRTCDVWNPRGNYKTLCNLNWMDYLHPYTFFHFLWLCCGLVFDFFYVVGTMCTFGSINSSWVAC
jgi:hypothetical protein